MLLNKETQPSQIICLQISKFYLIIIYDQSTSLLIYLPKSRLTVAFTNLNKRLSERLAEDSEVVWKQLVESNGDFFE